MVFAPPFDGICVRNLGLDNFSICDEAYPAASRLDSERQGRHPRMLAYRTAIIGKHGHCYGYYMPPAVVMRGHGMWEKVGHAWVHQEWWEQQTTERKMSIVC